MAMLPKRSNKHPKRKGAAVLTFVSGCDGMEIPPQVWVKPSSEMGFLYGNHVTKVGLGRITENTTQNQGVVIFSMADVPLGFGVAAKSTQDCRKLDPGGIVAYHQSDVGEYLRNEEEIG